MIEVVSKALSIVVLALIPLSVAKASVLTSESGEKTAPYHLPGVVLLVEDVLESTKFYQDVLEFSVESYTIGKAQVVAEITSDLPIPTLQGFVQGISSSSSSVMAMR